MKKYITDAVWLITTVALLCAAYIMNIFTKKPKL